MSNNTYKRSRNTVGRVEVSHRFVKELQGALKLWLDNPKLKLIQGDVTNRGDIGYQIQDGQNVTCIVDGETFLQAIDKSQKMMGISWFGK